MRLCILWHSISIYSRFQYNIPLLEPHVVINKENVIESCLIFDCLCFKFLENNLLVDNSNKMSSLIIYLVS